MGGGWHGCCGSLEQNPGGRGGLFINNSVTDPKAGHHVCDSGFLKHGVKNPCGGKDANVGVIYI